MGRRQSIRIHGARTMSAKDMDSKEPTVRELASIPLGVIESLAKAAPSQAKRYVREILARIKLEQSALKRAEISSHAQDSMMVLAEMHRVLGVVVETYSESLSVADRLLANVSAMTTHERTTLVDRLLEPDEAEDDNQ